MSTIDTKLVHRIRAYRYWVSGTAPTETVLHLVVGDRRDDDGLTAYWTGTAWSTDAHESERYVSENAAHVAAMALAR
jgi:hypothetical protein